MGLMGHLSIKKQECFVKCDCVFFAGSLPEARKKTITNRISRFKDLQPVGVVTGACFQDVMIELELQYTTSIHAAKLCDATWAQP